ncbi:MAG: F0F1 ATP synthase subunit epsilon [Bacillota bacterium]|nr:F0F1 ATP synthase subunit epsilon [Bacillota bacterium]
MAANDRIRLEIVTPEKEVFHEMVERFSVPAEAGSTGVLYNHAPLLSVLQPGVLTYVSNGAEGRLAVGRGFLELHDNEAEILVAFAERAADIDVARAEAAKERAERRLRERSANIDVVRAEAALHRAIARLRASGKY